MLLSWSKEHIPVNAVVARLTVEEQQDPYDAFLWADLPGTPGGPVSHEPAHFDLTTLYPVLSAIPFTTPMIKDKTGSGSIQADILIRITAGTKKNIASIDFICGSTP